MPGNGLGDRVHNFFAQDNSLQGQHQSHVLGGNWQVPNNTFWVGNQRQTDLLNSNDIDRGQHDYSVHAKHGTTISQSNLRPEFATSQSLNEQQNMNGFMYGNQFYQTQQNEANFRTFDADSDQRHVINSTGLSVQELRQRNGPENHEKASGRQETSVSPVSFDLFGGHQQMSHHQPSMLQPRQQELQQLDVRSQNQINQVSPFTKQASDNVTPNSDGVQYPWTTEHGTNWLSGGLTTQSSPSGFVFSPNTGQAQRSMDMVPKQVDQSLYGVPVSNTRGLAVNQYSQTSLPQMSTSSDSFHGIQQNFLPDQMRIQDGTSFSRQKSQGENIFEHVSSQSLDKASLQRANSMQRITPPQDFLGRLELPIQSKTSHERQTMQANSSLNDVALDPTEEKILFGSDDNIWNAFGKSSNMSGEAGKLFDNGGLLNGSWSALMQSAVAETSDCDTGPQEEWNGLNFSNTEDSSAKQSPSLHDDNITKASLPDERLPSALRSGSVPPSDGLNTRNVMGSNQLGHKFQNEHSQRALTDMPQSVVKSLEGSNKWSNRSPLQRPAAETSQLYASQHSLEAERNVQTVSATRPQNSLNNQMVRDGTSPFVHNNAFSNQWKNANPLGKFQAGEGLGRMVDQVNDHNLGLNSLNSCDKEDNSSDSHCSNLSQHAADASGSRSLAPGKQKSTNQLARKVSGARKFQYHTMGNLDHDVEPTNGVKHPNKVQDNTPQNTHFGQSQFFSQAPRYSSVMQKGQSSEVQKEGEGPQEESPRASLPGYAPNVSVPFTRPLDSYIPNKDSSPGQNMLELIHKVDQSSDHGAMMHLSSLACNQSSQLLEAEKPAEPVGRFQRTQSSAPQGFGLQLGPPSQRYHTPISSSSVQSYQFPNGESQVELQNNRSAAPGHAGNEKSLYKVPAFDSGILYPRSQIQNQQMTRVSGEMAMSQDVANASRSMQRVSGENGPPDSSQILRNMWTNQHPVAAQYQSVRSHFTESPLPNIVESSSAPRTQGVVDVSNGGSLSSKLSATHMNLPVHGEELGLQKSSGQLISSVNIDSVQKKDESLGEASSIKNPSDDSPSNSASTQNDIEAFGRSLRHNLLPNQKHALLNQMKILNNAETDPSGRFTKRMKGPDNIHDVDHVNSMIGKQNEHRDSLGSSTGVPYEDSRVLNFSTPADIFQRNASAHGNVHSHGIIVPGVHVSQSSPSTDYATAKVEHSQGSPQMAPSWFNQYASLKNGQHLHIYNTSSRPGFILEKPSGVLDTPKAEGGDTVVAIDAYRDGRILQNSSSIPATNGHLSSPPSSQLNVTGQHQMTLRPKKRKSGTCDLHPWHKEMSNGSRNLWTLRLAEAHWSKAVNHLTEKVNDESELTEHGVPVLKSKRRLILTTQLMQLLFLPPPATILTDDASSTYENVTYAVSRLVLRDACSTVPHSSELNLPSDGMDRPSAEGKPSVRNGDPCLIKVTEELMGRARKIENAFLRLEKSTSMLDVTLECQDLEKFSVMNRFAKYHGRGPNDNTEMASINATAAVQKFLPQRYVTALPVPRNLPDRKDGDYVVSSNVMEAV